MCHLLTQEKIKKLIILGWKFLSSRFNNSLDRDYKVRFRLRGNVSGAEMSVCVLCDAIKVHFMPPITIH